MKEATGELSTTVITVVAIAAISSLFIVFLYPQLKASIILNQGCSNGPGYCYGPLCPNATSQNGTDKYTVDCPAGNDPDKWTCTYTDEKGNTQQKVCNQSR